MFPQRRLSSSRSLKDEVMEVSKQYADGLINPGERYNKVIDIWANVTEKVADEMMKELGAEDGKALSEEELQESRSFNSIYMMADSGARGSTAQIRQLAGMRGLMASRPRDYRNAHYSQFPRGIDTFAVFISNPRRS